MRKHLFYTAALLLAGAVMAACSGSEDITDNTTPETQIPTGNGVVELSGTLGSKGEMTRAVNAEGTGTWEVNDKFAVYYETTDGHATAVATVTSVNGDGSANFTALLKDPKKGNNSVKLVSPASAHDGEGGFKTDGLMNQGGTLEYINKNGLDIETATATMNVADAKASLTDNVTMQPQVCLYKMDMAYYNFQSFASIITKLEITNDKNQSYTITPAAPTNSFTIAMLPVNGATFTFTATTTEDHGIFTKQEGLTLSDCTADNVGDVFDKDGNIYKVSIGPGALYTNYDSYYSKWLEAGKFYNSTPRLKSTLIASPGIAVIAYVGDNGSVETGSEYRGLALAMYDSNTQQFSGTSWCAQHSATCTSHVSTDLTIAREWKDGISMTTSLVNNTDGHTHNAAKAASNFNVSYPSGTSGWFLASLGQWQLIMQGLITKQDNLSQPYSVPVSTAANEKMTADYLEPILGNAGTGLGNCYWTSSEYDANDAWTIAPSNGAVYTETKTGTFYHVRPVIAFK